MTVHIDVERVTQRSLRTAGVARRPFVETRPNRGLHLALALAIGLAMWAGIIAAAPSVFHLMLTLIRLTTTLV
jgi:hypothetical protein